MVSAAAAAVCVAGGARGFTAGLPTSPPPNVGAYYYPWYGTFSGGHGWTDNMRSKLVPAQSPALGAYNNRLSSVIESHIDQSHRGNINFWATSW
jgi:hypothetical protein